MHKLLTIFNRQTVIVLALALVSSALSLFFQLNIYIDFLILSLIIVFPLTITIKEAFNRREKAIRSYSGLKASLQTIFYAFECEDLSREQKVAFRSMLSKLSENVKKYLSGELPDEKIIQKNSESIARFMRLNNAQIKKPVSQKIIFFSHRILTDIEFLLATKRHRTPTGIRSIILFAIYAFVAFYPASLLHDTGFSVALWYVFAMTGFKSLILISLYNAQVQLEDPFNPASPDSIRLDDFQFNGWIDTPITR